MSLTSLIKNLTPILELRKRRYEKIFSHRTNSFRGIFNSFESALASAPETMVKGFDVKEFEGYFDNRRNKLFLYDYPILFWMDKILSSRSRVFDIGGNTGVHFIGYRSYLKEWENIKWDVCEVPVVVEAGKDFAEREGYSERLNFTDDLNNADGADLLLSLGTIQYIENPSLPDLLASLENAPNHLLLGKLPLYDGKRYVTLQNGGVHFVAQQVFNRDEFLGSLEKLGYRVIDEWQDHSRSCNVPFYPKYNVPVFTGLYLARS
tara:strand:- start:38831 stop:39619 length:789 start_codon:yes stop_codon:yes gene_type:complete